MSFASFVDDHGEYASRCGYCKRTDDSSIAHGLWANRLTVDDYQELIDRGWRRSGAWLYKPALDKTCCPPYTIRLDASKFQPTKEHKKVIKRMQGYLKGKRERSLTGRQGGSTQAAPSPAGKGRAGDRPDKACSDLAAEVAAALGSCVASGRLPEAHYPAPVVTRRKADQAAGGKGKGQGGGAGAGGRGDSSHVSTAAAFAVAAVASKAGAGGGADTPDRVAAMLVEELAKRSPPREAVAVGGYVNFPAGEGTGAGAGAAGSRAGSGAGRGAGEAAVGPARGDGEGASPASPPAASSQPHQLEVTMIKSEFVAEEFELYCRYQANVHGDDPKELSESAFSRFLVDTPLVHVEGDPAKGVPKSGFGSFHQQYRIDGKLVAVGVVDILPRCLSSKYLFWDPDYAHLSLGKYSALREIEWVQDAGKECPSLQYYYLGYYIHKCPKMKYKAQYAPAELLCPVRHTWVPYEAIKKLLDERDYVVLSDHVRGGGGVGVGGGAGGGEVSDDAVGETPMLIQRKLIRFQQLLSLSVLPKETMLPLMERLRTWHRLCGPAAKSMVYVV